MGIVGTGSHSPSPLVPPWDALPLQIAATITKVGRTMAVWDESFGDWNFSGTPALPNGSVLLNWQDTATAAAMTDAG